MRGERGTATITRTERLSRVEWGALIVGLLLCGALYVGCIDREAAGFWHDDGVYAITGRALAAGEGPQLPHRPTLDAHAEPAWQVRYPIGYPLLLAAGFSVSPAFPDNLLFLQSITVAFALAAVGAFYVYLRRVRGARWWIAALSVLLTASSVQFVVYSTMLMSELPYLLVTIGVLALVESRREGAGWGRLALATGLTVVAFHLRTFGLLLAVAVFTDLVLRRQRAAALTYAAGFAAFAVAPWWWWTRTHSPPVVDDVDLAYAQPYGDYASDFVSRWLATLPTLGERLAHDLDATVHHLLQTLLPGFLALPGTAIVAYLLAAGVAILGVKELRREGRASALYVGASIVTIVLWNYESSAPRFLVVLLPWLWFAIVRAIPLEWIASRSGPTRVAALAGAGLIAIVVAWPTVDENRFVREVRARHATPEFASVPGWWSDHLDAFRYLRSSVPADAVVAARQDVVFHLYTDRPTFYLSYDALPNVEPSTSDGARRPDPYALLLAALDRYGVDTVVVEPEGLNPDGSIRFNQVAMALLHHHPERFRIRYSTPAGLLHVYDFLRDGRDPRAAVAAPASGR